MNENDNFDDKIVSSQVCGDETNHADNRSKLIDGDDDVPHVLEIKSSGADLNNYYILKWQTVRGDILLQRFWSGSLTFWMLYVGSLALFALFFSNLLPYPPSNVQILSSTTTFIYYGIYGIMVTIVILPFMNNNGLETADSHIKKGFLSLFPILFGICMYFLWNLYLNTTQANSIFLITFIFISIGLYIISYFASLFRFNKFSYFELVVSKNIKYVRGLLKGQQTKYEDNKELSYHDRYLALNMIKTDRSLNDFFFKSFKCREVLTDIIYNTPSLLWLSFMLGLTFIGTVIISLWSLFVIKLTYNKFKSQTTIDVHGVVIDTTNVTEDQFDLFVNCWNTSIVISVVLASLLSFLSLVWHILVAVNIRYNLRTGLWRYNRKAYLGTYSEITLVDVPGNQIGIVLFGIVLYGLTLQLFLFMMIYPPLFQWVLNISGGFLVALCIGILIKMIIVYLLFNVCLNGKRNLNMYSTAIVIMYFVNLLYGVLSAFYRLCYYIGYSFVAIFRFDVTILPTFLWSMDNAYVSYNAFLLYEHETQNPILRCAVELFSRNTVKKLYTYPSRSLCAYTCKCLSTCNSKSSANHDDNINGDNNNVNINNSGEDNNKAVIDESLNVYGFQTDMNETILSSLEADIRSRRMRRKWFLAYTLIKNPSLIATRYREEQEVERKKKFRPILNKISKSAVKVITKLRVFCRSRKNGQHVESKNHEDSSQNHSNILPLSSSSSLHHSSKKLKQQEQLTESSSTSYKNSNNINEVSRNGTTIVDVLKTDIIGSTIADDNNNVNICISDDLSKDNNVIDNNKFTFQEWEHSKYSDC